MSDQPDLDIKLPDPAELSKNLVKIAQQSQQLVAEFLALQGDSPAPGSDPMKLGEAFMEMTSRMMADPGQVLEAQLDLWQQYLTLWSNSTQRFMGKTTEPLIQPDRADKRFKDAAWNEIQVFDYLKQSYLLTAQWLQRTVHKVEGLDEKTARKVDFYTRQFVDAMAPSNFVLTNPEVLRTTIESNGENLVHGLQNMLGDLERGKGKLAIKMVDSDAFQVGKNVATSPGKVVYQNDLMQLLMYNPTTAEVHQRPIYLVPPWINKFYVVDLRPDNSMIRWLLDKGYTVFVVSWVNPDTTLAAKSFEDYMFEGIFDGLDAVEKATGQREVNAIGYCIGGTLMAAALAYMAEKKDNRIKSVTYFAAQVDFSEAGELEIFIDEDQLRALEESMSKKGYLEGTEMAATFNLLRANDLIWSFVVNNYLLGKEPFPFDLLYWNSDSTRMPARMHSYYLRNMYQRNLLVKPGALEIRGVPIDLRKIKVPVYLQASKEDHIAPYRSVYKATQIYAGPVRFVLAGSGHIAGVVNPPQAKKYQHWLNETKSNPPNVDDWIAGATEHRGSWWDDWDKWLAAKSGPKVPARDPARLKTPALEDAPGSYVKVRSIN